MQCTEDPPTDTKFGSELVEIDYGGATHKSGIVCGNSPHALLSAQNWVQDSVTRLIDRPGPAADTAWTAARIAWELLSNASTHSASGLPDGIIRVELSHTAYLLTIAVTDAGPAPSTEIAQIPRSRPDRNGLRRIDELGLFWTWDGGVLPGRPLTVSARIELP